MSMVVYPKLVIGDYDLVTGCAGIAEVTDDGLGGVRE
jgi:hypothetical protein